MSNKRVVVTGYGIVSCIGDNKKEVLQSLKDVKSGISPVSYTHLTLPTNREV